MMVLLAASAPSGAVLQYSSTPQYYSTPHLHQMNVLVVQTLCPQRWRLQLHLFFFYCLILSLLPVIGPNYPTKCFHCKPTEPWFSLIQTQNSSSALRNRSHLMFRASDWTEESEALNQTRCERVLSLYFRLFLQIQNKQSLRRTADTSLVSSLTCFDLEPFPR